MMHDTDCTGCEQCGFAIERDDDGEPVPPPAPRRATRVSDLVASYADDNTEAAAGLVRSAKVAWATLFYQEAGGQTVQVGDLLASGVVARADVVRFLSEAYSRAVFETAFALYFDRADPMLDQVVLALIEEGYSQSIADSVYAHVAERGVVLGSSPTASRSWRLKPRALPLPAGVLERVVSGAMSEAPTPAVAPSSESQWLGRFLRRLRS